MSFIQRRILWIVSGPPIWNTDFSTVPAALAWLTAPAHWAEAGRSLAEDARESWRAYAPRRGDRGGAPHAAPAHEATARGTGPRRRPGDVLPHGADLARPRADDPARATGPAAPALARMATHGAARRRGVHGGARREACTQQPCSSRWSSSRGRSCAPPDSARSTSAGPPSAPSARAGLTVVLVLLPLSAGVTVMLNMQTVGDWQPAAERLAFLAALGSLALGGHLAARAGQGELSWRGPRRAHRSGRHPGPPSGSSRSSATS